MLPGMPTPENTTAEAEILAYYDVLAWRDQAPDSVAERLDSLITELCLAAIARDRDLLAAIVRAGIERGRGAAMRHVCRQHRGEEERAEQALAESAGVLIPINAAWCRQERGEPEE